MIDETVSAGRVTAQPAVEFDIPAAPELPLPAVPVQPANFVPPAVDEHLLPQAASGAAAIS